MARKDIGPELPPGAFAVWHKFAAVDGLVLSIPKGLDGGVIELRGDNGQGKSTVVSSLQALAQPEMDSKDFDQTPTDGCDYGFLKVKGVVVNLYSKKTTFEPKDGRVEARILNGGPLGKLIDPRMKGDKPRSEARNKALAELVDLQLTDAALELLSKGENALKVIVPRNVNLLDAADVIRERAIALAQDAKRDAEIAGKEAERLMEVVSGHEMKLRELNGGESPDEVGAVTAAKSSHEQAVRIAESRKISHQALQDLLLQREEFEPLRTPVRPDVSPIDSEIDELDDRLPEMQQAHADSEGRRATLLQQIESNARSVNDNASTVARLRALLETALQEQIRLQADGEQITGYLAQDEYSEANRQARADEIAGVKSRKEELKRDRLRIVGEAERWDAVEAVFAKPIEGYASEEDVYAADMDIDQAANQLEQAQVHELMLSALEDHKSAANRASEYARLEAWYRDIGWTVIPQVIADRLKALGLPGIEMRAGVLFGEHPNRAMIPFDELSPGQQIRLALQVALRGHDPEDGPAILPFQQEYWDALTPRNRAIMRHETKRSKVWMITATARYNGALRLSEEVPADELEVLAYIEEHGEQLPEAEAFMELEPVA